MTNEQLAALLQSYVDRLYIELGALDGVLPEDLERSMEMCQREGSHSLDLEWRPEGDYVILDGLNQFASDLEGAIEALGKGE